MAECSKLVEMGGMAAQKCREDQDHLGPCATPDRPRSVRARKAWLEEQETKQAHQVLSEFQGPALTATEAYSEDGEAAYAARMEGLAAKKAERLAEAGGNDPFLGVETVGGEDMDQRLEEKFPGIAEDVAEATARRRAETGIKRMDPQEFRDGGYLQEANRLFFHPLGLALEVMSDGDDHTKIIAMGGVWDYRDDPKGMNFGPGAIDKEKARKVARERNRMGGTRLDALGYIVQPVSGD